MYMFVLENNSLDTCTYIVYSCTCTCTYMYNIHVYVLVIHDISA